MRALKIFFALALFAHAACAGAAQSIAPQSLHYAASYRGIHAGRVVIRIEHDARGYFIVSSVKPSLFASMFAKAHVTETRFVNDGARIVLDSGNEKLTGENHYAHSFRIDRELLRVEFAHGEHAEIFSHDQFEAAAFPLLLMLRPHDSIAGARVREVSARRLRDYIYDAPQAETTRVPAGEFAAWKITRRRAGSPSNRVTIWLHRSDNPVPLKIVVDKRGKRSLLQLTRREN